MANITPTFNSLYQEDTLLVSVIPGYYFVCHLLQIYVVKRWTGTNIYS